MAGLGGLGIIGSLLQGFQQGQQNAQQRQLQQMQAQMQMDALRQKFQQQQQQTQQASMMRQLALSGALDATGNPLGLGMGTPDGTDQVPPQTPGPGQPSMPMVPPQPAPARTPLSPTATDLPMGQQPSDAPGAGDITGDPTTSFAAGLTPGQPSAGDPRGMIPVIQSVAKNYNIDPNTLTRVSQSEGLGQYTGDQGTSFGATQLHVGGGLGDVFQKQTGLDPRDPRNEPAMIDFTGRTAPQTGWTPYHGAARVGIGSREGLPGGPPGQQQPAVADVAAGLKIAGPMSKNLAVQAANQHPTQIYGGASMKQMMQAIDKIAPDAPDVVKWGALQQFQKMMAPAEKQQMQMMMLQNRQEFAIGMAQLRSELAAGTGGTPLIVGGVPYNVKGNQATPIQGLPTGQPINRIGANTTPGGAKLDQDTLDSMADQYLAGDKSALTGLGYGNIGAENRAALRKTIQQRAKAAGMDGKDIAARIAEFTGITAGERTLGTRAATLGLALNEAKAFVPLALDLSDKIDRTQFPNFNSIELAVEKGTGDENVARFNVANRSIISLYSQVLRRGGVPSDQSDREAQELLQTAYSQGQYKAAVDQIMKEANAAQASPAAVRSELRGAITGRPSETTPPPAQQTQLPTDLPDPKGLPDGKVAVDENGKVVARISGGKWTPP